MYFHLHYFNSRLEYRKLGPEFYQRILLHKYCKRLKFNIRYQLVKGIMSKKKFFFFHATAIAVIFHHRYFTGDNKNLI